MSPTITSPAATHSRRDPRHRGLHESRQARGKPVDERTDIWAFGCVLYEMLTSQRAFDDEDVSLTLSKVLQRDPDLRQLPPHTPAPLRKLVQRCLNKNVKDRLQAIGDARTLIQELTSRTLPPLSTRLKRSAVSIMEEAASLGRRVDSGSGPGLCSLLRPFPRRMS